MNFKNENEKKSQKPKGGTVKVCGCEALSFRDKPNKQTGQLLVKGSFTGVVKAGEELKINEVVDDQWLKVFHPKHKVVGFVMSKYTQSV